VEEYIEQQLQKFERQEKQTTEKQMKQIRKEKTVQIKVVRLKEWLTEYQKEIETMEKFETIRLVCQRCGTKIKDDGFLVLPHPNYPNEVLRTIYLHVKGKCPRPVRVQTARERWLEKREKK
jgi:uncharacterized transporter YbjL